MRRNSLTVRRLAGALLALPIAFGAVVACAAGDNVSRSRVQPTLEGVKDSMGPVQVAGLNISNFGVVDGHIFRGEQPTGEDFAALKKFGITTIIDLRDDALSSSRSTAEAAGLKYVSIPLDSKGTPDDASAARFLSTVKAAGSEKVYVHCAGGRHRTGSMVAIWRVAEDGWTADQAFKEMEDYDYYSSFGHGGHKKYVFDYYARMTSNPASVPVAYGHDVVLSDEATGK